MNDPHPSTFCTVEFYEHELQTTNIAKGQKADYDYTVQYTIKIDDFFLYYLQKKTTTIELHQAKGSVFETLAACQLSFRDLIDKQSSRIHGTARLICVDGQNVGATIGTLEYYARMVLPVEMAFLQYKQRTKAFGYLVGNMKEDQVDAKQSGQIKARSSDNMNELNINILRCTKVDASSKDKQPSPYCVYKFFDFPDHDTEIVTSSNNPEFNDHKSFAVAMDIDLDKYLKSYDLEIYVFDDSDPENTGQYLGVAKIPLIPLSHDKDIKGKFELKKVSFLNGVIKAKKFKKILFKS